jgi:hypothetical protein
MEQLNQDRQRITGLWTVGIVRGPTGMLKAVAKGTRTFGLPVFEGEILKGVIDRNKAAEGFAEIGCPEKKRIRIGKK